MGILVYEVALVLELLRTNPMFASRLLNHIGFRILENVWGKAYSSELAVEIIRKSEKGFFEAILKGRGLELGKRRFKVVIVSASFPAVEKFYFMLFDGAPICAYKTLGTNITTFYTLQNSQWKTVDPVTFK